MRRKRWSCQKGSLLHADVLLRITIHITAVTEIASSRPTLLPLSLISLKADETRKVICSGKAEKFLNRFDGYRAPRKSWYVVARILGELTQLHEGFLRYSLTGCHLPSRMNENV